MTGSFKVGVISDTHGMLRAEAVRALAGSQLIIHAGDIGPEQLLLELRELAPVVAVRGNVDTHAWAQLLPEQECVEVGKVRILVVHDVKKMSDQQIRAGYRVIISGHSHRPSIKECGGVLYFNPGSAGPRRFKLPVTVAYLHLCGEAVAAEIVELSVR